MLSDEKLFEILQLDETAIKQVESTKDLKLTLNYYNRKINETKSLIQKSKSPEFESWGYLAEKLQEVESILATKVVKDKASIMLAEVTSLKIKAEQQNFKLHAKNNLAECDLEMLIDHHIKQDESKLVFALANIGLSNKVLDEKFYEDKNEFNDDLNEAHDFFNSIIVLLSTKIDTKEIAEVEANPIDYYIKHI